MTQSSTEFKSTLTDENIVEIARKIDQFILDLGKEYHPTGIELSAIALGRLMVFTEQVECYDTFHKMLVEISKMSEPEFLSKAQDVK